MDTSKVLLRIGALSIAAAFSGTMTACSGGGSQALPLGGQSIGVTAPVSLGVAPAASPAVSAGTSLTASQPAVSGAGESPLSADSLPGDHDSLNNFIDSIGVNTKLSFAGSVYSNYPAIKAALINLGVRHIRDTFSAQNLNNYENNLSDLAAHGVHSLLGLTISEDSGNHAVVNVTGKKAVSYLQAGHFAQSLEAVEGINEPDINQSAPTGPSPIGWASITQTEQRNLYAGIQTLTAPAKRVPVFGPSVAKMTDLSQVGDLSQSMDFGNFHDYSGGYNLPTATIASMETQESAMSGSKPVVASENGYSTGTTGQGMPDAIMLDYAQRLFFKQFAGNVRRTYWYEFADESATPNQYWLNSGLINNALAPKLAYTGLKNIMTLLKDQTPYTNRRPLNVSFGSQGQFENLTHLLLQKNDGSYWLVVWSDVSEWNPAANGSPGSYPSPAPPSYANSMNFLGTYVASITAYREDGTGAMTSAPVTVNNGSSAQITVGVRPTIFKIVPGTPPAIIPSAPAVANPAAHWSFDEGSGTVAADSVGAVGNLTIPTSSKTGWLTGRYKAGIGFYGTQAETTKTFIDTTQSYSATAWVEMNSLTGYQAAVSANGQVQSAFALDFTPQSNLSYTSYPTDSSAGGGTRIGSSMVPVIGHWYAVAATYNGATRKMSFYVNGVLQGTATAAKVFNATGSTEVGSMRAGGVGHYQWWNGGVDEVNLYQRELTAAEVATMAGL